MQVSTDSLAPTSGMVVVLSEQPRGEVVSQLQDAVDPKYAGNYIVMEGSTLLAANLEVRATRLSPHDETMIPTAAETGCRFHKGGEPALPSPWTVKGVKP